ncbi:MAG TPA: DNA polymerase III subunit beta [Deltaproteobacteria bacterium]|nr:DNA polymerase III subunit beta [Deltaproteobacteria bacterium]
MNIILDKNILLAPITKLVSITERKSIMPILSNILIDFEKKETKIISTDIELSAIIKNEFQSGYEKKVVVHGRKIVEILREMEMGEIELEIKENTMKIRQKNTEITLSLQDPEEFPEIKGITGVECFTANGRVFIEMMEKVVFAISTDETRYVLTGMHMVGKNGKIKLVGTDGFRMALYQANIENLKDFKGITIPKRSVLEIEKIIDGEEQILISTDEKHVQVNSKTGMILTRTIEGNFPDYENVIPTGNKNIVSVNKEMFLKGLKKVSALIGKNEPVRVSLKKDMLLLESESEIGYGKEQLGLDYGGEEMTLYFNIRFLTDVLTHIESENVVLRAPSTYGAVIFEDEENKDYINIIMPIKV